MAFGQPTRVSDRATFYLPTAVAAVGADDEGVPFDPAATAAPKYRPVQVLCAVTYVDRADQAEVFGSYTPSSVMIELLDPEYQQVQNFAYVVIAGDRYVRRLVEPPIALGSIDVWTVWVLAEDES